jgi:multiple RNA-binding domain-containing protein 1
MSRLIVKNLPPYITPALLKEHFSQSKGPGGTITDVKVALKQDGTARRFGFVGFKTDEDALKAKEWYDKTYIDSTRVRVEIIDVGVPYGSYYAASQPFLNVHQGAKGELESRLNKRPRLDAPSTKRNTGSTSKISKAHKSDANTSPAKVKGKDASFEEFMEVMLPKTKIGPGVDRADHSVASPSKKGKTQVRHENPQEPQNEQGLTDMEWMRQRMKGGVEVTADSEKVFEQSDSEDQAVNVLDDDDPAVKTILQTARLFIRNLTFTCTEDELRGLFQPFGTVSQVSRPCLHGPRTSLKGYGQFWSIWRVVAPRFYLSKALTIFEAAICTDCRLAGVSKAQFRLCLTHRAIIDYQSIQVSSFIPPKIAIPWDEN